MLRVKAPSVDSASEDFSRLKLGSSDMGGGSWTDRLNVATPSDYDKRGSLQLSTFSGDDSRPQSSMLEDDDLQLIVLKPLLPGAADDDNEEVVKKREKPKRVTEEVYTDKDRAAMVLIGTKDIKAALETQKVALEFKKTPEGRNTAVLFQQARYLMQQSRYPAALTFIDRALKLEPLQSLWLVERARCYFRMMKPKIALDAVNEVLAKDPHHFQALCLKGDVLYSMWNLESAMLCFVEGLRLRPDNLKCVRGVHKVKMALEEIPTNEVKRSRKARKRSKKKIESADDSQVYMQGSKASDKQYLPRCSLTLTTSQPQVSSSPDLSRTASPSSRLSRRGLRPSTARPGSRRTSGISLSSLGSELSDVTEDSETANLEHDGEEVKSHSSVPSSPGKSSSSCGLSDASRRQTALRSLEDLLRDLRGEEGEEAPEAERKAQRPPPLRPRRPRSCIAPKISRGLRPDKVFLEAILRDKGLKTVQTPHTAQTLQMAREAYRFVVDRRRYWTYREGRVASAPSQKRPTLTVTKDVTEEGVQVS